MKRSENKLDAGHDIDVKALKILEQRRGFNPGGIYSLVKHEREGAGLIVM